MADFNVRYEEYRSYFENELNRFCSDLKTNPKILGESMTYSLLLGGKRVRPVLMYAVGEVVGVDRETLTPYAIALEMIHTYSLIHDDLPEMDNDDFRRGKPSNHKKFGQANAVLAGDGLLNTAFSMLFAECYKGRNYISAAKLICDCAGINGMIAGQSADILHEHDSNPTVETLDYIYDNKTAKLITAALCVPSVLNGGKHYSRLKKLGEKIGYLFQLTDDILDAEGSFDSLGKSVGKDEKEDKLTAVKMYGVQECKLFADMCGGECTMLIDGLDGEVKFLHDFVNFVKNRHN
ncbi:MAG: polyprenyl synthetase family protein [Candidatus Coproplasma sp.]